MPSRPAPCPHCAVTMREVTAHARTGYGLLLDQCPRCGGIWCDRWELFPLDARRGRAGSTRSTSDSCRRRRAAADLARTLPPLHQRRCSRSAIPPCRPTRGSSAARSATACGSTAAS